MQQTSYTALARALIFVHGTKAESEAAFHANLCERSGDNEYARTWRQVGHAVRRHII